MTPMTRTGAVKGGREVESEGCEATRQGGDAGSAAVTRASAAVVTSRWGGPRADTDDGAGASAGTDAAADTRGPAPGTSLPGIVGWDVGGVNTKVARVHGGRVLFAAAHPYEVQRDPAALPALLRRLAAAAGAADGDAHAVTMTAELSQMFRTKREGVSFVLDAVAAAFPGATVRVFDVDGRFLDLAAARAAPIAVAASNWAATARVVAGDHPDALLVDVGSTTADVIPIVAGAVVARGRTDPERLTSGELVYTGALRTPVEAIVHEVPLRDGPACVSAEGFALAGDVHVWRGTLDPADYTVAAPDGRPAAREFARERLARVVCADRELLDDAAIDRIADHVAAAQVERVAAAARRVAGRHPALGAAVVTGLGDFIAAAAAERAGLRVWRLADRVGAAAARCAPAAAVALLLAESLSPRAPR
jgi:(4-(4-[2-(gamma-L-glutamylamino)ethyl]phenoxymethyl)furan-2-yl)methanamine synthase